MSAFKVLGIILGILALFFVAVYYTIMGEFNKACLFLLYFCAINQLIGGFLAGRDDYRRQKRQHEIYNELKKEEETHDN